MGLRRDKISYLWVRRYRREIGRQVEPLPPTLLHVSRLSVPGPLTDRSSLTSDHAHYS